jgi:hypothetical protein
MPASQVLVGAPTPTSNPSGQLATQLGGKQADGIVSKLHGDFYTQNVNGNVYYGSNAAGGAVYSIFSNTSYTGLLLWNPQGSGKNLSIIRASIGVTASAATAIAGFGYSWIINAGAGIATGAPLSAFGAITATRGSCVLGATGQGASVALVGTSATLTTAFGWGRSANFTAATGAITTQVAVTQLSEDFLGTMIVPPGVILALTTSVLTGFTATGSFLWEECPL